MSGGVVYFKVDFTSLNVQCNMQNGNSEIHKIFRGGLCLIPKNVSSLKSKEKLPPIRAQQSHDKLNQVCGCPTSPISILSSGQGETPSFKRFGSLQPSQLC